MRVHIGSDSAFVRVTRRTPSGSEEIALPLEPLYQRLRSGAVIGPRPGAYPADALRLEGESKGLAVAIYLNTLSARETPAGVKFWGGGGDIYLRLKDRSR